jgi:hypothetical protein
MIASLPHFPGTVVLPNGERLPVIIVDVSEIFKRAAQTHFDQLAAGCSGNDI